MHRYTLRKEFRFEASHQLMHHDGKCARLHGHSWVLVVEITGSRLATDGPKRGMLMDYADIKRVVKPLIDDALDHHHLNDTLSTDSPTSEFVARWVWNSVATAMFGNAVAAADRLAIEVEETCTSACRYEFTSGGDA